MPDMPEHKRRNLNIVMLCFQKQIPNKKKQYSWLPKVIVFGFLQQSYCSKKHTL